MSTGWICPKCGRVYAPFVFECTKCNNNEIKPDPCIITPPWSQDYSKYKSEVTTDTYKCNNNVEDIVYISSVWGDNIATSTAEYNPKLDEFNTNLDRSIHKYSSQEQLQESLDGLNKELENHGVQPTNLNELEDIKKTLNQDSNDDMWPTEKEVKAHLKYIKEQTEKEQTESEKNIIDDESYWKCTRCGKIHLVFPEGGCECGAPLEYLTYVI